MKTILELAGRNGRNVEVQIYDPAKADQATKNRLMELYREGYPDSFDEFDLAQIQNDLDTCECVVAVHNGEILGAQQFVKYPALQDVWFFSYLFVRERGTGVGRMICAMLEELLTKQARIVFTTSAGLLMEEDAHRAFFEKLGYREWAVLPGWFRDDMWGIFFVKRNPHYAIGKGIPRNSGWCNGLVDEVTGQPVSREDYRQLKHGLEPVPKAKWGLKLLG